MDPGAQGSSPAKRFAGLQFNSLDAPGHDVISLSGTPSRLRSEHPLQQFCELYAARRPVVRAVSLDCLVLRVGDFRPLQTICWKPRATAQEHHRTRSSSYLFIGPILTYLYLPLLRPFLVLLAHFISVLILFYRTCYLIVLETMLFLFILFCLGISSPCCVHIVG